MALFRVSVRANNETTRGRIFVYDCDSNEPHPINEYECDLNEPHPINESGTIARKEHYSKLPKGSGSKYEFNGELFARRSGLVLKTTYLGSPRK